MPTPPPPDDRPKLDAPESRGPSAGDEFQRLVDIMRLLRSPDGCPWDREQTWRTLAPYVQEEAAEVVDAIERDDPAGLREEVGDLIFEGVFLAQVADQAGHFTATDALRTVSEKLVRRHPHVFRQPAPPGTSAERVETPAQVVEQWGQIKAREKAGHRTGLLDGVPSSLPALAGAHEIGRKVARVGFDWPDVGDVLDKVLEEIEELRRELTAAHGAAQQASEGGHAERVAEEIGDLLFSVAQLARTLGIDPEAALRAANRKFRARFGTLESLARGAGVTDLSTLSLDELEAFWQRAKREPASSS